MRVTGILHRKQPKTYLMASKVKKAVLSICAMEYPSNTAGFAITATATSHTLIAKATEDVSPETLALALEIVHSHMYFITDEALCVALLIAAWDERCDKTALAEQARPYLNHHVTMAQAREASLRAEGYAVTLMKLHEHFAQKSQKASAVLSD